MSLLRQQMNGAVSQSMRDAGAEYGLNYGVSIPVLRAIARDFAPDHELAKLLYKEDIREAVLAAAYISDPAQVTLEELPFWASGIHNTEVADHMALAVFSRCPALDYILEAWIPSPGINQEEDQIAEHSLYEHAALMAAASNVTRLKGAVSWDWRRTCEEVVKEMMTSAFPANARAVTALFSRLITHIPESGDHITRLLTRASAEGSAHAIDLAEELGLKL